MLVFLRAFWSQILVAVIVAGIAWKIDDWRVTALKAKHQQEIKTAVADAVKIERDECTAQQKLTQGVSDAYQKKLSAANARYNAATRELLSKSRDGVPSSPGTAGGHDAASGTGRLYYADPSGALPAVERSFTATKQAGQLIACQEFIRAERK